MRDKVSNAEYHVEAVWYKSFKSAGSGATPNPVCFKCKDSETCLLEPFEFRHVFGWEVAGEHRAQMNCYDVSSASAEGVLNESHIVWYPSSCWLHRQMGWCRNGRSRWSYSMMYFDWWWWRHSSTGLMTSTRFLVCGSRVGTQMRRTTSECQEGFIGVPYLDTKGYWYMWRSNMKIEILVSRARSQKWSCSVG